MFTLLLAATLALAAQGPPASAPSPPQTDAARAVAAAELLGLPPALQERFHAEVLAGHPPAYERLQRIARFVTSPEGLGITYAGDATASAAEAYASRRANCLGFALLFLALAREAGLDAYAQDAGETLGWRELGGTILRANHVNVSVRVDDARYTLDVGGELVFGTQAPMRLADEALFARYYNNVAVDHLMRGEQAPARREMARALALDPYGPQHWSNAGVLALREGDVAGAQRAYAAALALDPNHAPALLNMVSLARRTGDRAHEATWRRRLERVQRQDPVHQFIVGLDAERAGDYARAIDHYRRAIRLQRREHRFHSALARVYLLAGDARRAASALKNASRYSDGTVRAAYRDELRRLQATQ